jgi:hypothetical protein
MEFISKETQRQWKRRHFGSRGTNGTNGCAKSGLIRSEKNNIFIGKTAFSSWKNAIFAIASPLL